MLPEAPQQLLLPRNRRLLRSGTWTISGAGSRGARATPVRRHLQVATRGSLHGVTMPGQHQRRGFAQGAAGPAMELAAPAGLELGAIRGTRAGSIRSDPKGG